MNSLDVSDFESALRFVAAATGKEEAPLVNKYSLQVVIGAKGIEGAMQRTPKANAALLRQLDDKVIRAGIVKKLRKAGKLKGTSTAQILSYVRFEKQRRIRSVGYTAFIGWTNAAQAFGGTGARGAGKTSLDPAQFGRSEARKGKGTKATASHLTATFSNTAPMAEEIGFDALQDSLDAAVPDMEEYGNRKLQEIFDKVGAS